MTIDKFINKIKYLTLPLRQHGTNVFESNSKVKFVAIFFLISLIGCGSAEQADSFDATVSTQAPPFIHRVDPTAASRGATVTLFGLGFSSTAGGNVISIGGTSTTAATYALVNPPAAGEIEQLTFTIPAGAAAGATNIAVTVFDNTSNTVAFTVNP